MTFVTALMGFFLLSGSVSAPEGNGTQVTGLMSGAPTSQTVALADQALVVRDIPSDKIHTVKLTAYNAVPEQTDGTPLTTASGAPSNPEVVAARSVDLAQDLPYGTIVSITREGKDTPSCRFNQVKSLVGYRVIADSMHSRKRNQIDILLNPSDTVTVYEKQVNPSVALGVCETVTVTPVGKLSVKNIPDTQEELKAMVEGTRVAMR